MKKLVKIALPFFIVVLAVGGAVVMKKLRPKTERRAPQPRTAVVEVVEVAPAEAHAMLHGTGVVEAARTVTLSPEVSGRVVWQADELVPGGRLPAGSVVARIDERDYELALAAERSRLRQAKLELQLEESRQGVAEREYELLGGAEGDANELTLRKPHLETAQAALEGAQSAFSRAELNLERTRIKAPFNALVLDEKVEVGQIVGPNSPLATLIGTDSFWVRVSVAVEELAMLDVPGLGATAGSRVTVTQELGPGRTATREGRVLRLLGQLDAESRTAQVLVGIDDPLQTVDGAPPLLPGAYVSAVLEGRALEGASRVPRQAFSDGDLLWTVAADDTLRRKQVQVGWRGADDLFVVGGLEVGDRVVVSPLSLPVEGMPVRLAGAPPPAPVAEGKTPPTDPS
jgi:RND family efflux transporter MFP subunit